LPLLPEGATLVIDKKEARTKAGVEVIMGLFDKLFKKRPDPDPVKKEKLAATPPPAPEVKKRTSWIDELADPDSPVHEKLKKLPETPKEKVEPAKRIGNNVTIKHEQEKREQIKELSHIDLGQTVGTLGCFLNYSNYKVIGNDEQGKRRIKIRTGINEQQAIEKAMNEGLLAPFKTEVIEHDAPTERQLECLKSHGTFIPDGITKDDASCMISRLVGDDDLESPAPWLVALANGFNIEFSAFIGAKGLFRSVIYQANERDRAALFGYAVRQSLQGSGLGNMLADPAVGSFYSFADQVVADPSLLRSLNGREPEDYIHPHKGTAIYKAAASRLSGGGA